METIVKAVNLAAGAVKGLLFGILAINTIGVILFVAGFALCLGGVVVLGVPLGLLGMYIVFKTDDKL
jgi:hypothetical protein